MVETGTVEAWAIAHCPAVKLDPRDNGLYQGFRRLVLTPVYTVIVDVVSRNAASQLASWAVCPWLACLHLAKTSHSCRCPLRHSFLLPVPAHFDQPVTTHTGNTARRSMLDLCFCP